MSLVVGWSESHFGSADRFLIRYIYGFGCFVGIAGALLDPFGDFALLRTSPSLVGIYFVSGLPLTGMPPAISLVPSLRMLYSQ